MTNSTEGKDEQRFASSSEHRATPGREAGVVPRRQIAQKNEKMSTVYLSTNRESAICP